MSVVHSQRPGTIYTTATMHTHTGSVHSLSYASGSGYTSPVRVMSPPPAHGENVIEPYTLRPTLPPSMVRKTSETTMRTAYDISHQGQSSASSAVALLNNNHEHFEPSPPRERLNPPAYSPYPSPTSSPEPVDPTPQSPTRPGHRTHPAKASVTSVDSQQSYETLSSSTRHASGGVGSISAIDDVIGRMGLTMTPGPESVVGSTMGAHTVSTGQSANILSRPTHKPGVSNPDNDPTLG